MVGKGDVNLNVPESPAVHPKNFPLSDGLEVQSYPSRILEPDLSHSHWLGNLKSQKTDKRKICASLPTAFPVDSVNTANIKLISYGR